MLLLSQSLCHHGQIEISKEGQGSKTFDMFEMGENEKNVDDIWERKNCNGKKFSSPSFNHSIGKNSENMPTPILASCKKLLVGNNKKLNHKNMSALK